MVRRARRSPSLHSSLLLPSQCTSLKRPFIERPSPTDEWFFYFEQTTNNIRVEGTEKTKTHKRTGRPVSYLPPPSVSLGRSRPRSPFPHTIPIFVGSCYRCRSPPLLSDSVLFRIKGCSSPLFAGADFATVTGCYSDAALFPRVFRGAASKRLE